MKQLHAFGAGRMLFNVFLVLPFRPKAHVMLPCPFGIGGYTNFPRRSERVYEVSWWRGRALPVAPGKAGPDADLPNAAFDPKPAVRQPGGPRLKDQRGEGRSLSAFHRSVAV